MGNIIVFIIYFFIFAVLIGAIRAWWTILMKFNRTIDKWSKEAKEGKEKRKEKIRKLFNKKIF